MSNTYFSVTFNFRNLRFDTYHYTDNRAGYPMNFIALMRKGHARLVSKDKTILVNEGDVFFIPYKLSYQSYWYGEDEIDFLSYGFSHIEARESLKFALQIVPCDEELKALIAQIPTDGYTPRCKTLSIFYDVLSQLLPYLQRSLPYSKKDEILHKAQKYILQHTDCSVAEAARNCYISEPYLYQIFKEKTGSTPNNFRLEAICRKGIEYLITTDKTVDEISTLIGLSSASHFRKLLNNFVGLTPREIRKKGEF